MACASAQAASAATLVADYRFADSRASSVGSPPALTDIDTDPAADNVFATEVVDGAPRRVLQFPQGNGLQASTGGVIPASSYTIVVLFRLADTSGFRRIIDFEAGSSDSGLYSLNGSLTFFGSDSGADSPISPSAGGDPYHEVVLTRDSAGEVAGYVDGTEQFRFDDTSGNAVIHPGQTLTFFKDDDSVSGEESAGAVANIRLYDGPLEGPPPSSASRLTSRWSVARCLWESRPAEPQRGALRRGSGSSRSRRPERSPWARS